MNRRIKFAALTFVLLLAGCSSVASTPAAAPSPAASAPPAATPSVTAQPVSSQPAVRYPASWTLPDRRLSPGAVQPGYGIRDVCPHVNPALESMRPSTAEKALVYRAYGIFSHPAGKYEIDHIIPVELLGQVGEDLSAPARNLYPELNDVPDPVMLAKYHLSPGFVHNSKDVVEDVLHKLVCAGTLDLSTAQKGIAQDWRAMYVRYVGPPPHLALAPAPTRAAIAPPSPSRTYRSSAAPYPTHSRKIFSAPPAQAACYPKTSGGNCYRAGEFCRKSDLGSTGVAGNGERIRCEASGSRNRWEPA